MPQPAALPPHLHGLAFRTSDRELHGSTRSRLRRGDVEHPHHGVSAVDLETRTVIGRCRAYEPLMAHGQYFSHTTAAQLFEMPMPASAMSESSVHVAVSGTATRPRTSGIIGHGLSAGGVHTTIELGFAVIAPDDTWCHLASMLSREDLVAVGDYLISGTKTRSGRDAPLATRAQLAAACTRHRGRRGARALAWALPRLRAPVDSRPESLLRLLLVESGYPEPLINDATVVDGGATILHPDLKWPHWRIVLEYEGDGHRTNTARFRADIARKGRFEAAGWRVIRVTFDDLETEQAEFLARVQRTVELQEARIG